MLSTQLTSEGPSLFAEWIEYDRTLDSAAHLVLEQRIRSSRHPTTHAFRSISADVLREQGYVVSDSSGVNYYAPDAEVLLSDAFMSGHCFRLVESAGEDDRLVGVAFTPSRDRRDMREIEGTLWVARATSELRLLEFRYLNLPDPAGSARPGGRVEFVRLDDGNWLVSRWNVRMPDVGTHARTSADGTRRTVMSPSLAYLRAVRVTGGEVESAAREGSIVYRGKGPAITVQVTARDSGISVAGAMLTLRGTDYAGTADSQGRIRLAPVLAGRYRASVRTPLMELLGMPAIERELNAHDDGSVDSLALPSARDVLASACPRDSISDGEGMLHGRVRDEGARAIVDAVVLTTWNANFSVIQMKGGASIHYDERTRAARTDAFGYWRSCGVPLDTPLSVAVATTVGSDAQKARLEDRPFGSVDLVLHPKTLLSSDVDPTSRSRAHVLVEIIVTDEDGAPIPNATLVVRSGEAQPTTFVTGTSGRALIPDAMPGPFVVSARRIGFKPGQVSAILLNEDRVVLLVRLGPDPT
jgi:hypothetical protein